MIKKSTIYFILILNFILINGIAQDKNDTSEISTLIKKYREILSDEMNKNNIAGLCITVVDSDSIIWAEGLGWYDTINRIKVSSETPFQTGSLTKLFTGIGIMQLQEKGLLNIDSSFVKYVPEFKMKSIYDSINDITIRSIMTHHAGIPNIDANKFTQDPEYFTKLIDYINNDYATNPVNILYKYSNSGISLLGNLIENVSGDNYFDYIERSIVDKIDMENAGFFTSKNQPVSCLFGYDGEMNQHNELPILDAPAGSLYASATDMSKFMRAFLLAGEKDDLGIITKTSQKEMTKVQNSDVFYDFGVKTGLIGGIRYNRHGKLFSHGSGNLYHRGILHMLPNSGLGVVILSNSANANKIYYYAERLLNDLADIKGLNQKNSGIKPVRNIINPEHNWVYSEGDKIDTLELSEDIIEKYLGTYAASDMAYEVRADKKRLFIDYGNYGRKYLIPTKHNEFIPADTSLNLNVKERYYFELYNNNTYLIKVYKNGFQEIWGTKVVKKTINSLWLDRLGTYKVINTVEGEKKFVLRIEHDLLALPFDSGIYYRPLKIINDNLAIVYGFVRGSGSALQFIKDESGKEYLLFRGYKGTKID